MVSVNSARTIKAAAALLLLATACAVYAQAPTLGNNTSACGNPAQVYCSGSFAGLNDTSGDVGLQTLLPDPAPANVSTADPHALLYTGTLTKIIAHMQAWFCKPSDSNCSSSHVNIGYSSNDAATVHAQMNDIMQRHIDAVSIDWYGPGNTVVDQTLSAVGSDLAARYASITPTVSGVSPASGPTAGGTNVTITGTNFRSGIAVTFAGVAATAVVVVNSTSLTCITPAGSAGAADVTVTNTDGTNVTLTGGFSYTTVAAGNLQVSIPTGGGSVTTSVGGISCPSTCSATVAQGASVTATATAASGWGFAGWAGLCGGTANPCTFTMPSSGTLAASFTPTSSGGGTFNILNMPRHCIDFLTNNIFCKPLPNAGNGGPMTHLMPNSDAVISHVLAEGSNGNTTILPSSGSGGTFTSFQAVPGPNDYNNAPLYFGTATDPTYHITGIKKCGTYFEPYAQRDSGGYITNMNFHAPSGAQFSGQNGSDQGITVWDRSGSGTLNGWFVSFYGNKEGALQLPACASGTTCNFARTNGYCAAVKANSTVSGVAGGGAASSMQMSPWMGHTYFSEVMGGHIRHAMYAGTACEATAGGAEPNVVFPATGYGALKCQNQSELALPNGALIFLDYTAHQLDCMNPSSSTTCTGNDGNPIAKLRNVFQYAYIEQFAMYGRYESDTGGPSTSAAGSDITSQHQQASQEYLYYSTHGFPTAFSTVFQTYATWFNGQCAGSYTDATNPCYTNGSGSITDTRTRWLGRVWYGVPKNISGPTCTAANACGVLKHLHIADPCVAVALAGLPSATVRGRTWAACPQ